MNQLKSRYDEYTVGQSLVFTPKELQMVSHFADRIMPPGTQVDIDSGVGVVTFRPDNLEITKEIRRSGVPDLSGQHYNVLKYVVYVPTYDPGTRWEPPTEDVAEAAALDNLTTAIKEVALQIFGNELNNRLDYAWHEWEQANASAESA